MRLLALPLFFALAAFVSLQEPVTRVIEPGHRHLGNDETPEWSEAPAAPEGKRLDLEFKAKARSGDSVLWIRQRSVDNVWRLKINDKDMGTLKTNNEPADFCDRVNAARRTLPPKPTRVVLDEVRGR